ncbi:helix-turn-helix domain-containing protein [Pectinatus sottacetonis]|uniref:helix-turn-helix domain-containing protein n=1 Tax=Pectinatus sottacetonis TaxID=1002795 RepID=UPI0018C57BFD|nr:helix-turn-helix transcriptional regulator [Pectinatus sottacetonis]
MENTFAQVLKHLIKFSGIKLSSLADFIGYDVSYISKWCNNTNQPSVKYITRINNCISSFIANEIINQNQFYPFLSEFNIKLKKQVSSDKTQTALESEINNMLMDAYYQHSQAANSPKNNIDFPSCTYQTIIGRTNVKKFFNTKIALLLSNIKENIEIYITGDIITLLTKNYFFDFLNYCHFSAKKIDIHIGCSIEKLYHCNLDFIINLYNFFNKFIYIDFHIHNNKKFHNSNIIVIKNYFSLQYSLHDDNLIDICTYINEKSIVNNIWERTYEKFSYTTYLIEPKNDIELVKFRSFFYLNNNLIIFCAKGFEFFLPKEAFNKLLDSSVKYKYSSDMRQTIQNMQITWEEQFEKAHIDFFLPEANIMHYIENGKLTYGEIDYTTSVTERELQFQQLIKSMKNNPNINILLLNESQPLNDSDYFKLSYYSNTDTAYLKKNKAFLNSEGKTIYLLKNPVLINKFNSFFLDKKNQANCHNFSAEELEKIYKKNISFLHRIWIENKKMPSQDI